MPESAQLTIDGDPGSPSRPSSTRSGWTRLHSIAVCTVVFAGLAVFRLIDIQYGLDFTDPGAHLSAAMRYHLGDLPFRDEWNHTLGMFDLFLWSFFGLFPQVGLYEVQALALGLNLAWLGAVFLLLRRYTIPWALALACLPVAFMSHGVKTPGYNEFGQAGLCLALSLWVYACLRWHDRKPALALPVLAGLCFTVGALSYLPLLLILVVPVTVVVLDCFAPIPVKGARPATRLFLLTVAAALGAFVATLTISGLLDDYYTHARWHLSVAFGGTPGVPATATGRDRIARLYAGWAPFVPHFLGVLACLWLGMTLLPRRARLRWPVVLGLAGIVAALIWMDLSGVVNLPSPPKPWSKRFELNYWLVLTALALNVFAFTVRLLLRTPTEKPSEQNEWRFVRRVFLAAALMYLLVQTTFSTNKILNATFAAPPLFIFGVADLCRSLRTASPTGLLKQAGVRWRLGAVAVLLAWLGAQHLTTTYVRVRGDDPLEALTASFSHRYLRGIRSTPERVESVEALLAYLEPRMQPGDFLHQQDDCPMIYFLLRARPALSRVWSPARRGFPLDERQRMLDFMLEHNRIPQYFVRWNRHEPIVRLLQSPRIVVHEDGTNRTPSEEDPIRRFFHEHYGLLASFGQFQVFGRYPETGADERLDDVASRRRDDMRSSDAPGVGGRVFRDMTSLLAQWRFVGKPEACKIGRNARGGPEVTLNLSSTDQATLLPEKSDPPLQRLLPPLGRFDFRLRVELSGQAAAVLILRVCSDETSQTPLAGKRVPLRHGLNSFTVYTAKEPVYIWPAFKLSGQGSVSIEEFVIFTVLEGVSVESPDTADH